MWIPDGSGWDGINDRFALVPRSFAKIYFGRWPRILNGHCGSVGRTWSAVWFSSGSLLPMMLNEAPPRLELSPRFHGGRLFSKRSLDFSGPEWSLLAALRWHRVPLQRFGSTGAVLCLDRRRARHGRCTRPVGEEPSYKQLGWLSKRR